MRLLGLGILLATACTAQPDAPTDCSGDRCQSAESRDELLDEVADFTDPIATYLRDAVRDDGTLDGDYRQVLDGVGEVLGCASDTESSFLVLSNEALNAKSIFNRCASSPVAASEFFLLLPTLDDEQDFEPELIHMTAWDQEAGRYRRYSTFPAPEGGMHINVEPSFCLDCHGGPRELGTWQPLMNEMTNPWSQWNAEPGFASHVFDEYLSEATAQGVVYAEVSADGLLDSASNFEPIIRAGIDRVTGARIQTRHNQANLDEALALLQPVFCDEMVNYVSEIHGSGEIRSSALIDDGFREIFAAMGEASDLPFLTDTSIRIAPRLASESNLSLVTVRGESSLRSELSLVTRQVLSPLELLQVRSLDYKNPVDSPFRCGLYQDGSARIRAGAADALLASLPAQASNAELVPGLLAEIMSTTLAGETISLQPDAAVYALPDAALAPTDRASLEGLRATPAELAQSLQRTLDDATRDSLEAARQARACQAAATYPTASIVPDVVCP